MMNAGRWLLKSKICLMQAWTNDDRRWINSSSNCKCSIDRQKFHGQARAHRTNSNTTSTTGTSISITPNKLPSQHVIGENEERIY